MTHASASADSGDLAAIRHRTAMVDGTGSRRRRTFDRLAEIVDYGLYLQDYGGPIGFRLALAHPERVRALIVQNAVAHEQGLTSPLTKPRRRSPS
jgi:pimeloyl-ACP methyl ester carboxylesterase